MSVGPFNLGAVAKRHKWLSLNTGQAVEAALKAGADHAAWRAKAKPNYRNRTGATGAATRWTMKRGRGRCTVTISNPMKLAGYLEWGTRPHIIRARRGLLSFWWVRFQKHMLVRQVNHPGTRPYRSLLGATEFGAIVAKRLLWQSMRAHAKAF